MLEMEEGMEPVGLYFLSTNAETAQGEHGDFYFDEFSMANFAKDLVLNGLLIHDKNDDIAPYSEAEGISKNWKNSQFITTENYGHSLFFDEVDNMIIDFLKV